MYVLAGDEDGQRRIAQAEFRAQKSIAEHIEKTVPLSQPPLNLGAATRELIDNAIAQRRASSAWAGVSPRHNHPDPETHPSTQAASNAGVTTPS